MKLLWPFRKSDSTPASAARPAVPDIIIAGLGVRDRPDLSVEAQNVLRNYGRAMSLGLTTTSRAILRSLHVQVTELDSMFSTGRNFPEVYADVVQAVITRAGEERPAILLVPGNPMFMNGVSRTIVVEGRRLGLNVVVLPGISLFDTLINEIGIDAGLFGLQVFDAFWMTLRQVPLSPHVPVLLFNLEGFGLEQVPGPDTPRDFAALVAHLERSYPPAHLVTLVRAAPSGAIAYEQVRLGQLEETQHILASVTCLYLDALPMEAPAT